jgi:hypothetical protein
MFNLFEFTGPAGFATPLHIHYAEDVAVFVLEGSLTVYWVMKRGRPRPARTSFSRAVRRMGSVWRRTLPPVFYT